MQTVPASRHPLQSIEWGQFRHSMGVDVVRTNDWQLTFHSIPMTPWTIGYFPKGPLPTQEMLTELVRIGKQKNAVYIQLEPNVLASEGQQLMNPTLLRPSHHPLFTKYTFVLDLTKSEDELLQSMHSKTRYNIKVAQKHDVQIIEDNSDEAFAEFLRLNDETLERQGFYAHNTAYYRNMWKHLRTAGIARLFTATYQKKVLAAWILFALGDTLYYPYGASSRENREVMAPNLILWEIAKIAKNEGYKKFDLWGALGPNPDPNDPFFGFHRFKLGFNPELVEFVGSFDLVIRPILYKAYVLADVIRWKILNLRR